MTADTPQANRRAFSYYELEGGLFRVPKGANGMLVMEVLLGTKWHPARSSVKVISFGNPVTLAEAERIERRRLPS